MDTTKIILKEDTTILTANRTSEHVTIKTIEYLESGNGTNWCNCQLLQKLIWPLTIMIIVLLFYRHLKRLIENFVQRIQDGDDLEVGPGGLKIRQGSNPIPYEKNDTLSTSFETNFPLENDTAKKIMSTFWIKQNEYDSKYNIRWTFIINDNSDYDASINKLHWLGLVAFDPAGKQYFLTDYGLHYCSKNKDKLGSFSYF